MSRNRIRAKYEVANTKIAFLSCAQLLDNVAQIIWEHGGAVSKLCNKDGYFVVFPVGTIIQDAEVDPKGEYDSFKWIYILTSKEKFVWISATVADPDDMPILQREKAPWT